MPPMDMPPTRAAAAALLLVSTASPLACTRPVAHHRTSQLFGTLSYNGRLAALGAAPIGRVVEGLEVADGLYGQYGGRPSQDSIRLQGDAYLKRAYPNLDQIRTARIVGEWQ